MQILPNLCKRAGWITLVTPFPQNCKNASESQSLGFNLSSSKMAVLATFAHSFLCLAAVSLALFSIAHIFSYMVANFSSTCQFCCGVPGTVYSNLIPSPSCLHAISKASYSPAFSQHMYFTILTATLDDFNSLINPNTFSVRSLLYLRK